MKTKLIGSNLSYMKNKSRYGSTWVDMVEALQLEWPSGSDRELARGNPVGPNKFQDKLILNHALG